MSSKRWLRCLTAIIMDKETRKRYLAALMVGLGRTPEAAEKQASNFIHDFDKYKDLPYSGIEYHTMDPLLRRRIEDAGLLVIGESGYYSGMKFNLGCWAVAIMKEENNMFQHLEGWCNYWTDGDGGDRYRKYLESH